MMGIEGVRWAFSQGTSFIKESVISFANTGKKIATNPSLIKKTGQVFKFAVRGFNHYHGTNHLAQPLKKISNMNSVIDIHGSVKNLWYWLNRVNSRTVDLKALKISIKNPNESASATKEKHTELENPSVQKQDLAETATATVQATSDSELTKEQAIVFKVLNEGFINQSRFKAAVFSALTEAGYSEEDAQSIVKNLDIQKVSLPVVEQLYLACFTIADLGSNLCDLHSWRLIDLASISHKLGSSCRVFAFVAARVAFEPALSSIAAVGITLSMVENTYKLATSPGPSTRKHAVWNLVISGLDLSFTVVPLVCVAQPAVLILLGGVAKGTGLIYALYFKS